MQSHHYHAQGDNYFPSPAGHLISFTGQNAIGILGFLGTLLACVQLAVDQYYLALSCWAKIISNPSPPFSGDVQAMTGCQATKAPVIPQHHASRDRGRPGFANRRGRPPLCSAPSASILPAKAAQWESLSQ